MLGLALALGSSACWGTCDFFGGLQARRMPLLRVMLASQGAALVVLCVIVAVRAVSPPSAAELLPAAGAGLAGVLGLSAFYRGLAIGTMSVVAPIAATGVAVPVVVGIATGDRPAALQIGGIVVAIVGVVLVSREASDGDRRRIARTSVLLALVAAAGFGSFFVGLRSSARHDVLWALVSARAASVLVMVPAAVVRPRDLGGQLSTLTPLVAIGLGDLAANGLYAVATRHGLLSVVAVGASLYPVATVLLARGVLDERVQRIQEIGIVAAVAGVVLIAAG